MAAPLESTRQIWAAVLRRDWDVVLSLYAKERG